MTAATCEPYNELPIILQLQRVMLIFSCLVGTLGLFSIASSHGGISPKTSRRFTKMSLVKTLILSATAYAVLGGFVLFAVSISAYNITFKNRFEPGIPQNQTRKYLMAIYNIKHCSDSDEIHYELGIDIYIGWISGSLAFVTAGLLAVAKKCEIDYEDWNRANLYDGERRNGYVNELKNSICSFCNLKIPDNLINP